MQAFSMVFIEYYANILRALCGYFVDIFCRFKWLLFLLLLLVSGFSVSSESE